MILPAIFLLFLAGVAIADLPVECYYQDIEGEWTFYETSRDGNSSLVCDTLDDLQYKKTIHLRYPSTAEDENGNIGTWTMVYDQGFEVRVAGRSYFAFSYFEKDDKKVTSFCDKTFPGWARDETVRNWSCFKGEKNDDKTARRVRELKANLKKSSEDERIYHQDKRFIDTINRHQSSWTAAAYPQFENKTLGEIFRMRGGQKVRRSTRLTPKNLSTFHARIGAAMIPKSHDWRNVSGVNFVRPVKNQGNCGSCYAFASIGVIESQLLINSGGTEQLDLSAEDVVGCSQLSQGCDGGFPYLIAGRYGQDVGLVSADCVPYEVSNVCDHKRDSCRHVYTTDYKYVGGYFGGCNEDEMKVALYHNGPLAVGIEVKDDFMSYKGGIYHHTGITDAFNPLEETNHAVLLVGYGETDTKEKFWTIQNSWGTEWGVDGYVYIRRGYDEIAVESMAVQATAYP